MLRHKFVQVILLFAILLRCSDAGMRSALGGMAKKTFGTARDAFSGGGSDAEDESAASKAVGSLSSMTKSMGGASSLLGSADSMGKQIASTALNLVQTAVTSALNTMLPGLGSAISTVINIFSGLFGPKPPRADTYQDYFGKMEGSINANIGKMGKAMAEGECAQEIANFQADVTQIMDQINNGGGATYLSKLTTKLSEYTTGDKVSRGQKLATSSFLLMVRDQKKKMLGSRMGGTGRPWLAPYPDKTQSGETPPYFSLFDFSDENALSCAFNDAGKSVSFVTSGKEESGGCFNPGSEGSKWHVEIDGSRSYKVAFGKIGCPGSSVAIWDKSQENVCFCAPGGDPSGSLMLRCDGDECYWFQSADKTIGKTSCSEMAFSDCEAYGSNVATIFTKQDYNPSQPMECQMRQLGFANGLAMMDVTANFNLGAMNSPANDRFACRDIAYRADIWSKHMSHIMENVKTMNMGDKTLGGVQKTIKALKSFSVDKCPAALQQARGNGNSGEGENEISPEFIERANQVANLLRNDRSKSRLSPKFIQQANRISSLLKYGKKGRFRERADKNARQLDSRSGRKHKNRSINRPRRPRYQ